LAITAFLDAQCFTRIYNLGLGALCVKNTDVQIGNGGGGEEEELVNSKTLHSPHIYLLDEGTWGETWQAERKRQSTNGQEKIKITALPMRRFALKT
jgi:hypothetical protein